ncbi:hypothetical protein B0T13DRAFT_440095 [Neurospora crassa]|nr:hypothetical protein B0T13DRAFT_440095 [Neurospora crassa]
METDPDSDLSALRSQLSSDMADDHLDIESTLRSSRSKFKELRRELDAVDIVIDKLVTSYTALTKAWSKVDQKASLARERASMEKDGEEGGDGEEDDDDKKRKRKDSSETEEPTTTIRSRRSSNSSSPPIDVSEATLDAVARILPLPLPQLEEDSGKSLEDGDMTEAATGGVGGGGGGGGGGSSTSHQQQQQGNRKKIHMDKREVKRVRTVSPESGSGSGPGSVMKSIEGDEVDGSHERDSQTLESEGEYGQDELPDNKGEVNLRKDLQVNVVFLEQQFERYEEEMNKRLEMYKSNMNRRVERLANDMNERVEKLERDVHKSIEKLENWMSWNEWVGETITYGGDDADDEDEEEEDSEEDSEDDEDTEEHEDDDDDDDNDDNDDNYNGNLPSPPDDHPLTNSANH